MRFSFSQYLLFRLNWKRKKIHSRGFIIYPLEYIFIARISFSITCLNLKSVTDFFLLTKDLQVKNHREKNPKQTSIYLLCLQLHTAVDLMMMMIMMIFLPISLCSRVYKRFSRNIRAYILFRHRLSAFHFKSIMCLMHSSGLVCSSNTEIYLKHHSPSFFHIFFYQRNSVYLSVYEKDADVKVEERACVCDFVCTESFSLFELKNNLSPHSFEDPYVCE